MSEDTKGTTVYLDADMIAKADAIAARLSGLVGGKLSRTAVVRRALADLFLAVYPMDRMDNQSISADQPEPAETTA